MSCFRKIRGRKKGKKEKKKFHGYKNLSLGVTPRIEPLAVASKTKRFHRRDNNPSPASKAIDLLIGGGLLSLR